MTGFGKRLSISDPLAPGKAADDRGNHKRNSRKHMEKYQTHLEFKVELS